jgi:dienelactone hydrolase
MRHTLLAVVCSVASLSPVAVTHAESSHSVSAFGRTIDLDPWLAVAPADSFFVDQPAQRIYVKTKAADTKQVAQIPLGASRDGQPADIAEAKAISQVDISKRNFWGAGYSELLGRTLILTDEAGEERLNLYTVEPDGQFERITDVGYIYGWSISPDGRWLAYASRESVEFSPGTIRLMDLKSRTERLLFQDSKALRPYWSTPAWRADSGAFLLTMVVDEDRALQNIALVTTSGADGGRPRLVTDKAVRREVVLPKKPWLDDRQFVYISTESGRYELYRGDVEGKRTLVPLSLPPGDAGSLTNASVIRANGKPFAVITVARPVLDAIQVLELPTGKVAFERSLPESVSLESALGDRAILTTTSPENPGKVLSLTSGRGGFAVTTAAEYARAANDLVQCVPEKVSFRTFDGLAAPGENNTLHAWLYRPKKPLPSEKAMLVVEAFYGGAKPFNSIYPLPVAQLFCAAGVHFLSPAPRGSWGMGMQFRQLIRGDLGGNEILDVVAAARWGQQTLGIPAKRIGAYGLSHGGYATMRLLTMPDTINGHPTGFQFGFGISDAGISNLLRHAKNSNIRGWSVELMGDAPENDPAKWLDRSPETQAARATGPLLLLHGTNDNRVRMIESQSMAEKLREHGKPVTYIALPGAAHGTAPVPQLETYWRAVFRFLEQNVEAGAQ